MALIIYPTQNWNSFADLSSLIASATVMYPVEVQAFISLPPEYQEAFASHAGLYIKTCPKITYPDPISTDFIAAQSALMLSMSVSGSGLQRNGNERAITSETVDVLSVTYDVNFKIDGYVAPEYVYRLLSPYGCKDPLKSGGFMQIPLGRN